MADFRILGVNSMLRVVLIGIFVKLFVASAFLIDENNSAKNDNFGADAQERPQGSVFTNDADKNGAVGGDGTIQLIIGEAHVDETIFLYDFLDIQDRAHGYVQC